MMPEGNPKVIGSRIIFIRHLLESAWNCGSQFEYTAALSLHSPDAPLMEGLQWDILERAVAAAPSCNPDAIQLLESQLQPQDTPHSLPVVRSLCTALALSVPRHNNGSSPAPEASVTRRILRGSASESEKSFWRLCQEKGLHEILSAELIDGLVDHLMLALADVQCPVLLEIGAGNGVLSAQLRREFGRRNRAVRIIACDNFQNQISEIAPVLKMSCAEALQKFNPDCVLVSWMPSRIDWTAQVSSTVHSCQTWFVSLPLSVSASLALST